MQSLLGKAFLQNAKSNTHTKIKGKPLLKKIKQLLSLRVKDQIRTLEKDVSIQFFIHSKHQITGT